MTLTTNELIAIAGSLIVAGKMIGFFQERLELRDWKEWRAQVDARFLKHEQMNDRRFDEASERMSTLASKVNVMPTQIEDRIEERFMERGVVNEKFQSLERRVEVLEQRQRFPRGTAS